MNYCSICKSQNDLKKVQDEYVCKSCYIKLAFHETSEMAYEEWQMSLYKFEKYENGVDIIIKRIIQNIDIELDIKEQQDILLSEVMKLIALHVQYYRKDEVYVSLLAIREAIRRLLVKEGNELNWTIISDISMIATIMGVMKDIDDNKFEDHYMGQLEKEFSNFITAICLSRRYNLIKENIQLTKNKGMVLADICCYPIETEQTESYFQKYIKNGVVEKPEDYIIKNTALKQKLLSEEKTPDAILNSLQKVVLEEFGFERTDYSSITIFANLIEFPTQDDYWKYIENQDILFINSPLVIVEKDMFEKEFGKERLAAILNTFSINRNINEHECFDETELFSFYEVKNLIIFGSFDFAQNISAFEKFLLSKDYIDVFKKGISQKLTKTQKKMSQYLSISIADYLYANGYKLPMEKYRNVMIPRAEIDKIKVNGNQILSSCGDIDVLAINTGKKEVILIEVKYYKPAMSATDMLYKDKDRIKQDEVTRKMKKREEIISENIDEVVNFILGEYQYGYKVKSLFLTPRTNYYAIEEDQLNYLTWAEFTEEVDKHLL